MDNREKVSPSLGKSGAAEAPSLVSRWLVDVGQAIQKNPVVLTLVVIGLSVIGLAVTSLNRIEDRVNENMVRVETSIYRELDHVTDDVDAIRENMNTIDSKIGRNQSVLLAEVRDLRQYIFDSRTSVTGEAE